MRSFYFVKSRHQYQYSTNCSEIEYQIYIHYKLELIFRLNKILRPTLAAEILEI